MTASYWIQSMTPRDLLAATSMGRMAVDSRNAFIPVGPTCSLCPEDQGTSFWWHPVPPLEQDYCLYHRKVSVVLRFPQGAHFLAQAWGVCSSLRWHKILPAEFSDVDSLGSGYQWSLEPRLHPHSNHKSWPTLHRQEKPLTLWIFQFLYSGHLIVRENGSWHLLLWCESSS